LKSSIYRQAAALAIQLYVSIVEKYVARYQRPAIYDKDLAARINQQRVELFDIEETRMFGGIAYMLNGNMCLAT
jgi:hypothetical protein